LQSPLPEGIDRYVLDGYIGSQVLQMMLAHHNLVLTRGGNDELSIAPSNVAMASVTSSNFLVPAIAVNNMLLGLGLCLILLPNGGFDIRPLSLLGDAFTVGQLHLPGDELSTRAMRTTLF
jgi:hypothetical protein